MRTGIHPIDIEALEREKQPWDPGYVGKVLYDLIGRQLGYRIDATPEEESRGR